MWEDIAFPSTTTLAWMAAAALAGAVLGMWHTIRSNYREWQTAQRKARGEDTSYEEWEATRYNPGAPSAEEFRGQPAWAVSLALYFAGAVWTLRELGPEAGQALMAVALGIGALVALLRDFRKTDDELGLNTPDRDPMKGPPTFFERHRKQLNELASGIIGLGGMALVFLHEILPGDSSDWFLAGLVLIVAYLSIRVWRRVNDPLAPPLSLRPEITIPREAAMGAIGAVVIVALVLALLLWQF